MNSKNILELTVCLSQALDQNYDVVDMDAVLAVISALEGTTITKEQLEATRLAKYINQLRRRTKSENLAKRAKSLLKKWREMVGIQPSNEHLNVNAIAASNDNSVATNLQPTSPAVDINAESMMHSKSNAPQADYLRSDASNTAPVATSFNPRSANFNVYNSHKGLDIIEGQSGTTGLSTKTPMDSAKQPTSFANLINFNNDSSFSKAKANSGPFMISASRFPRNKTTKAYERAATKPTETYIIDHSSNSNSEMSFSTSNVSTHVAPIVIDIQDSNSSSNLMSAKTFGTKATKMEASAVSSKVAPINKNEPETSVGNSFKPKKTKKEKRRKDRENQGEISSLPTPVPLVMVAIDETSSNQHRPTKTKDGKVITAIKDKSRSMYPAFNISEILTLSNSSMSSMFLAEGVSKVLDDQNRYSLTASNSGTKSAKLSTADLTFAGKFKQHNNNTSAPANNVDFSGFKEIVSDRSDSLNVSSTPVISSYKQLNQTPNKIIRFSGSGCNSNDSTSHSRASLFEVIDVSSHDHNNQLKSVNETSLLKLHDVSDQNSQQKPNATVPPITYATHLQQTTVTTLINAQTPTTNSEKIPKKRGRKKGSKGVDSVIAKETSLSSQMLITSLGGGGKKVKTTKELYAEMQNRKLGISTNTSSPTLTNWASQPQQLASRAESSCSEPSLHSAHTLDACSTNATISTVATRSTPEKYLANTNADEMDSDSDTIASEPSRESVAAQKKIKRFLSVDSNSNSLFPATKSNENKRSVESVSTDVIEKQLFEILRQLAPAANIKTIESECAAERIPCSCTIIEVMLDPGDPQKATAENGADIQNRYEAASAIGTDINDETEKQDQKGEEIAANVLEAETAQSKAQANVTAKPKKSIFDLDFDDDDDPLHTFMAEAAAASVKQDQITDETLPAVESSDDKVQLIKYETSSNNESIQKITAQSQLILHQATDAQPLHIFPTYQVEEDPECLAKQRFEIQTQKITKFHIDALHNCFIPNINGNWDNADTPNTITFESDIGATLSTDGSDVVPKYGSLVRERIRKDLSHVTFTKYFKSRKQSAAMEKLYNLPFLGISRITPTERTRQKNCVKVKYSNERVQQGVLQNPLSDIKSNKTQVLCAENAGLTDTVPAAVTNQADVTVNKDHSKSDVNATGTYLNGVTNKKSSQVLKTNAMLSDIMVDVTEPDNLMMASSTDVEAKSLNLLAIADVSNIMNYSAKDGSKEVCNQIKPNDSILILQENQNEHNTKNCSREEICVDVKMDESNIIDEFESVSNALPITNTSANADDKTSSRRSSSCSNSSLKQTQKSINLKLRRQRLLQQKEQELIEANGRKRSHKKYNKPNKRDVQGESGKRRVIKRIKIAINGNVATQRKISFGSSNNSTDEEESETDYYEYGQVTLEDTNNDDENYDFSMRSTAYRSNPVLNEDEYNAFSEYENTGGEDVVANDFNELDVDEYEFDEDDEEDYSGDFHEVVTRDISAPSTGNNHIVLTIKKTPSKTNSPSNSVSAMSPLIATATTTNSNITSTTTADTTTMVVKKIDTKIAHNLVNIVDANKADEEQTELATVAELIPPNADSMDIAGAGNESIDDHTGQADDCSDNKIKQMTIEYLQEAMSTVYKLAQKRIRRKLKKFRPIRFPRSTKNNVTTDKKRKLHQRLFFPHELYPTTLDGHRERLLNISSCSSSCSEESDEYEYYANWAGTAMQNHNGSDECSKLQKTAEAGCEFAATNEYFSDKMVTGLLKESEADLEETKPSVKNESVKNVEYQWSNNGLLMSFNNIYCLPNGKKSGISNDENENAANEEEIIVLRRDADNIYNELPAVDPHRLKKAEHLKHQLRNENCDDYNLYNNNNNFNLIKYDSKELSLEYNTRCRNTCKHSNSTSDEQVFIDNESEASKTDDTTVKHCNNIINDSYGNANIAPNDVEIKQLIPHKEYRMGLRAVDEDVDDDDGNNCARIQQFKEWHQVLQLRSYNEELLTVLPYVVLE